MRLKRAVGEGECLRWSDVEHAAGDLAVRIRREMEAQFGLPARAAPVVT